MTVKVPEFNVEPKESELFGGYTFYEARLSSEPEQAFLGQTEDDAIARLKQSCPFKFSQYDQVGLEPISEHFFSSPDSLSEILLSQEELGDRFDIETPSGLLQRSMADGGVEVLWDAIAHFIPIDSDGGSIRSCFLDSRRYAEFSLGDSGSYLLRFY
ncbi:hypothetical protein ACQ4M3_01255 [Leptolyngbya sp. AN03gr2]|uniref:hypothetical protein n=1 Tax=unclassified Leptolyngbya TaxID=2650499 RepID=UPI003D312E74